MQQNRNDNENKIAKKKKNTKNIVNTTILFTTMIAATISVIAIPLAINKKTNNVRDKYFDDEVDLDIKTLKTEKKLPNTVDNEGKTVANYLMEFNSEQKDISQIIFNKTPRILETSKKDNFPLVKYEYEPMFLAGKSEPLNNYYEKIKNKAKNKNIKKSGLQTIYEFDILELLENFYKSKDEKITMDKLNSLLTYENLRKFNYIKNSFTFAYEYNKKYYYLDLKEKYRGVNIRYFIKNVFEQIRQKVYSLIKNNPTAPVKTLLKEFKIEAKIELENNGTKIKHFYLESSIKAQLSQRQK
ncbi:hypothetical protein [Metamycoplasma buccale]|uniref:hypothetical protein n=1 Tax=Metamycoplasma buccale TaxID=55602 RepID=UPI00398F7ACE